MPKSCKDKINYMYRAVIWVKVFTIGIVRNTTIFKLNVFTDSNGTLLWEQQIPRQHESN